jgi:hypothetical protein
LRITDVTPGQVNQAVAAFISRLPADGSCFNSGLVYREVRQALKITADGLNDWEQNSHEGMLDDRVKRALDAIARRGELVRLGKHDRKPDNSRVSSPVYYTPASYERAAADAQAAWDELSEVSRRWTAVHERLGYAGLDTTGDDGSPVELTLGQWERLAGMLPGSKEECRT